MQASSTPQIVTNLPLRKPARKRRIEVTSNARPARRQRTREISDAKTDADEHGDPALTGSDNHASDPASTARVTRSKGMQFRITKTLLTKGNGSGQVETASPERDSKEDETNESEAEENEPSVDSDEETEEKDSVDFDEETPMAIGTQF